MQKEVEKTTAKELKRKIEAGEDFVLIDVLSKQSFDAMHVPKSINIPANEIEKSARNLIPDKRKEVIVYCSSVGCNLSPTVARRLQEMGYENVKHYAAGLAGWQDAGYEFEGESA